MTESLELGLWFPCFTFSSLIGIVIRWAVSLHPYSGEGKPPTYGDFEAQRHWMEITLNLPLAEWYVNSSDNDLMYWGLDYPPLTAYHMRLCGQVAEKIDPSWVALNSSRGTEGYHLRLFMRYTVLIADVLIYFSAICVFCKLFYNNSNSLLKAAVALVMLLQPSLILIDHGHFQYNCVSLGLTLWAIIGLGSGRDLLGSAAFVLALSYKQMELYHATPFFCYLLGKCLHEETITKKLLKLAQIGGIVVATFILCWFPFLTSKDMTMQVIHRLFPFSRGLFEDKVANFWCSVSPIIKMKDFISQTSLIQLTLWTTLLALIPSSWNLLRKPTFNAFLVALVNSSLTFFLFSYQVHEKSILLPALPLTLLLPHCSFPAVWFHTVATFSMAPLLQKDGLSLASLSLLVIFVKASLIVFNPLRTTWTKSMYTASCVGMVLLQFGLHFLPVPSRYPDLFPVLISSFSCAHFLILFAYFHYVQFSLERHSPMFWSDPGDIDQTQSDVDKKEL